MDDSWVHTNGTVLFKFSPEILKDYKRNSDNTKDRSKFIMSDSMDPVTPIYDVSSDYDVMTPSYDNQTQGNSTRNMYDFYQKEQIVFLIILFILIVVGNVSVLIAIGLSKRGQRSRMNFFIMHLALADLLAGFFTVLTDIVWKITLHWYAGEIMCKAVKYLQAVVTYGSTYVLVALSIDRLDAIARPMHFSGSGKRAKILIILSWSCSCVFSLPMIFIHREAQLNDGAQCLIYRLTEKWHWQLYMTLIAIALFIIPACIIAFCYGIIISIIWSKSKLLTAPPKKTYKSKSNGAAGELSSPLDGKSNREESHSSSRGVIPQAKIRTIKMTLVIVLAFILCWSPYFIFDLLDVYGYIPKSRWKFAVSVFIQSLAPLNSAANPAIYGIFSSRICRNLRRISACNWIIDKICCCVESMKLPERSMVSMYNSASMTSYLVVNDERRGSASSADTYKRRPESSCLRNNLTNKERDIVLRNVSPNNKVSGANIEDDNISAEKETMLEPSDD